MTVEELVDVMKGFGFEYDTEFGFPNFGHERYRYFILRYLNNKLHYWFQIINETRDDMICKFEGDIDIEKMSKDEFTLIFNNLYSKSKSIYDYINTSLSKYEEDMVRIIKTIEKG